MQHAARNNRTLAASLIVAAVGIAAMQDVVVKGLSGIIPVYEAIIVRSIVSVTIIGIWLQAKGLLRGLFSSLPFDLLKRSVVMATAYFSFVLSLAELPIATSVSIYFTMPFFVAGLAGWALGERVKLYRWIAIIAGFAGVLVMLRPDRSSFQLAALLALYSAFAYALGQMMGRKLSQSISPLVVAQWQGMIYGAVGLALLIVAPLFHDHLGDSKVLSFLFRPWVWPTAFQWLLLIAMGLFATVGSILFTEAYRQGEANFVAPFEYTGLLWAIINGVLFFGDYPDLYTLTGAGLVICAGLWMLHKDYQNRAHST